MSIHKFKNDKLVFNQRNSAILIHNMSDFLGRLHFTKND